MPSIGGFTEFAIMDLLELYASGQRPARPAKLADGTETDMNEIVQALTVEEIEAVGIYYSQQQWQPHVQAFDAALARPRRRHPRQKVRQVPSQRRQCAGSGFGAHRRAVARIP